MRRSNHRMLDVFAILYQWFPLLNDATAQTSCGLVNWSSHATFWPFKKKQEVTRSDTTGPTVYRRGKDPHARARDQ